MNLTKTSAEATKTAEITLDDSTVLSIPLEEPASTPAFFLFGLHKCGSTLMNLIFKDICSELNIPSISIPHLASEKSIPVQAWNRCEALNSVVLDGYCHKGFRKFPMFMKKNELLKQRKKILLVRDPRDAVVSAYFSFTLSHRLPKEGKLLEHRLKQRERHQSLTLEEFVLEQAEKVKREFDLYDKHLAKDDLLKVYRYEDVIFEKVNWVTDMLNFLGLSLDADAVQRIVQKHDIVPSSEDETKHVRKVTPGDHREKLSPECIAKLNEILADVLKRYNYA